MNIVITGGSGLRYFGVGASNQYRQDRITVYLRIMSTSTGEILKNVYVSKTILSQGISANLYRYVALRRLLEVETGVTKNEPAQLAVKEAIDKAVDLLIVEGIVDGVWQPKGGKPAIDYVTKAYEKEKIEAALTELETAVKGESKEEIDAKSQAVIEASAKLMEIAQAKQQAQAAPEGAEASSDDAAPADDVVDAEFEEVKEDK